MQARASARAALLGRRCTSTTMRRSGDEATSEASSMAGQSRSFCMVTTAALVYHPLLQAPGSQEVRLLPATARQPLPRDLARLSCACQHHPLAHCLPARADRVSIITRAVHAWYALVQMLPVGDGAVGAVTPTVLRAVAGVPAACSRGLEKVVRLRETLLRVFLRNRSQLPTEAA